MTDEEHVLVIPAARLELLGQFHEFRPFCPDAFRALLDPNHMQFLPRGAVEEDPSYKQLIPYAILEATIDGRVALFQYTRGGGQGERRLHAKRSIGIGGHIAREDASADNPYRSGMLRELAEEVIVESAYQEELVGFIFDDSTAVGQVHLGVVHQLKLELPAVRAREADLLDSGFATLDDLRAESDRLETWSRLCLERLYS